MIKSTYNESGIEVDNAYLDNVASVVISNQKKLVYTHDFRKQEFASIIDKNFFWIKVFYADSNLIIPMLKHYILMLLLAFLTPQQAMLSLLKITIDGKLSNENGGR